MFFHPGRRAEVWGDVAGRGLRPSGDPTSASSTSFAERRRLGDHRDRRAGCSALAQPQLALYVGGMGARGKNFYNDLARQLRLRGRGRARSRTSTSTAASDEAAAAVPDELVRAVSLIGPASYVAERVAEFRGAGVTTLAVTPLARSSAERIALMSGFRALVD